MKTYVVGTHEYPQHMFLLRNKKDINTFRLEKKKALSGAMGRCEKKHELGHSISYIRPQCRHISAFASMQSDRSLCCLPEDAVHPWLPIACPVKTLIRLYRCAG